jgi:hypothetical protein
MGAAARPDRLLWGKTGPDVGDQRTCLLASAVSMRATAEPQSSFAAGASELELFEFLQTMLNSGRPIFHPNDYDDDASTPS